MRGPIGLAFFLLMTFSILVFIPDLIVYGTLNYKANAVVQNTTKEAEMQGGITQSVQDKYQEYLTKYGLDNKGFTISYSSTGLLQQKEHFSIELKGEYTFKAFNLLGTGIGNFTLPISSYDSGISQVWLR